MRMLFAPTSGERARRVALVGDNEAWHDVYTRTVKDVEDEKR